MLTTDKHSLVLAHRKAMVYNVLEKGAGKVMGMLKAKRTKKDKEKRKKQRTVLAVEVKCSGTSSDRT